MSSSTSSIVINRPAEDVWLALTKAELVKQWQYGSILITDWKLGSSIRFHNDWEVQSFDQWGKIIEYKPFEILKYSLFAPRPGLEDKPENYFYMTYRLEIVDDAVTRLVITQDDPRPGSDQTGKNEESSDSPILQGLKKLVESK
jgi:uncharacterized protein YndB with AHSA1/START domain